MAPAALDARGIVAGIKARLAELAPLIEEHAKLTAALAQLTGDAGPAPERPASRTAARSRGARRPAARRRAPRGANRAALLTYVAEHPGATVAQIADATGIAKPTLHTTVSQLKKRGELIADGGGVKLPQLDQPARPRAAAARSGARRARTRRRATRKIAARGRAARRPAATPAPPAASDASAATAPAGATDDEAVGPSSGDTP